MVHSRKKARIRAQLLRSSGKSCWVCGEPFAEDNLPTVDHVVERSRGGKLELSNAALAHQKCNQLRSNKPYLLTRLRQVIVNTTKYRALDRWEDDGGFVPSGTLCARNYWKKRKTAA